MNYASRAPPQGRLNTSTLPPVICFKCRGPNHLAKSDLSIFVLSLDAYVIKGIALPHPLASSPWLRARAEFATSATRKGM